MAETVDTPGTRDNHGHRKRLRERFLAAGPDALLDHELLEMMLFMAQPRIDTKPLAKRLIERFGSFAKVISAEPDALRTVTGVGDAAVATIKTAQAAALRLLREEARSAPVVTNWRQLLDYCRAAMGHEKTEQFRLLFLDRKNRIIADEVQQRGTVDHTPVYPREVVRRALELHASAIIMVHNHPSGDPTPSRPDIDMTREIKDAAERLGIRLHDHVIIAGADHASFRSLGLL